MADSKSLAIRLSVNSAEAKAALEALSQSGGQSLDRLADKLRALGVAGTAGASGLERAANQNVRGFASVGEAADRFEGKVKGINRGVNDVRGALELMGGPLAGVSQGMGALTTTIGNVADVFGVLSNTLLRNPIGLVATGIAAAAAAFVLLRDSTVDATKAQEDLAKAVANANAVLDTQAEGNARRAEQARAAAITSLRNSLGDQQKVLAQAEAELVAAERRKSLLDEARKNMGPAASPNGLRDFSGTDLDTARKKVEELRASVASAADQLERLRDPASLGASRDAAKKEADDQAKAYEALRQQLDGAYAANVKYEAGLKVLNAQFPEGTRNVAEYRNALAQLTKTRTDDIARADGSAERLKNEAAELKRLNEATLRDVENYVKAHEKRERGLEQFIGKMEEEARLAGETNGVREEGRAILEAQSKLYDEQGRKVRDLTDAEKARITVAVRQKEEIEAQRKAAEKFAADMERTIVRSTDRAVDFAADTLYDAFTGKITSVGEFLKTTLLRAAAQAAAEMVFRPLIAPIVQAGVQAVVGSGLGSAVGVNAPGGSSSGGGLSLSNIGSLAKLGYEGGQQAGFWGNIFGSSAPAANAVYEVGGVALTASEAAQEAVAAGVSNSAAGAAGGIGSALGTALPIAGALYSGYNFAQNPTVLGGIGAAGSMYAGVSAGLGALGYSTLPFAGPVGWAAMAVMILSSIFGGGGGGSPVIHADQTRRAIQFNEDGSIADLGGPTGYYGASPSNYDYLNDVGKVVREMIGEMGGTAPTFQLVGNYDSIAWPGGRGRVDTLDGRVDIEATTDPRTMAFRAFKALLPLSAGIDAVTAAVARNSVAENLEDFAKDLDWATALEDTVSAVGDLGASIDKLKNTAKAAAVSMVGSLKDIETRADALGIGDVADAAIAKQIRVWMGAQGPQEAPSSTQTMLAQIAGAFAGLGEAGAKYGITAAEVKTANDNAVAKVRGQFNDSIQAILDPTGAALANFDKAAAQMRKDATDLGADLVATEKAIARQRQQILDQQLSGVATNVRAFLDGQILGDASSASPAARLAAAQGQFDAAVTGARAGDPYQSSRLVGAAQTLLGEGRSYYGSTGDFTALETFTRAQLSNLGSQQGWAGFPAALSSQTTALVNAQQLGAQAVVSAIADLREQLARVELELARQRARSYAA